MRIKLSYLLLVVLFPISVYCQNNIHEKRIYLLDVTKSMVGKGVVETPDIFEQVKLNLIEAINEIEDPQTEIVVVPFTNTPHEIISGFVSQKDSLSRLLSDLTVRNGDTNIADAWAMGVSLLDSTKVNYMFLLTDGLHNNGPSQDELYSTLKSWDSVRKGKYFFSFYVMLTSNAVEQNIRDIAKTTPQMWSVQSLNIKAALIRTMLAQRSNIYENKTVQVKFSTNNSRVFVADLGVKFSLQENPYYSITNIRQDSIEPTIYKFDVLEKVERSQIPVEYSLSLYISHNAKKYPLVFFTPEEIDFKLINHGVRRMSIKVVEE